MFIALILMVVISIGLIVMAFCNNGLGDFRKMKKDEYDDAYNQNKDKKDKKDKKKR